MSFLKSKVFLITGSTGFVGACLLRRLVESGIKPHIFIRKRSNIWRIKDLMKKVSVHYVDLSDYKKLKKEVGNIKPDVIYHLATYGGYHYQKDYDEIFNVNVGATFNLLKACTAVGFKLFVNTGSSSEYGIKSEPMKESDLLDPVTIYGASKAAATLVCRSFAKTYDLPLANFRLFSPYGYYEDKARLIPYVITKCLKGENPELTSGSAVRDFNFIEDVLDAYVDIAKGNSFESGEVFNIANGRQHSVKEVVEEIIAITGAGVKPRWRSLKERQNEPRAWVADISNARQKLGFRPKHDLKSGLRKTVDWFKANLELYN